MRPSARKGLIFPLLALPLLLAGAALASPAADYLGEVEGFLKLYDGPSAADRAALTRGAEGDLARKCAADLACPLNVGRDVAEALVKGFGDKHTNLKEPPQARRVRAEMRGDSVARLGLRLIPLGDDPEKVAAAIIGYVRPGSPAASAKLSEGDLVGAINHEAPTGANLAAAEDGDEVTLTLARAEVKLRPESLPARDLPTLRSEGGVNVVNIPSFLGEGVAESFFDTLRGLDPRQPLVIDVRANGGGSLNECLLAASAFVDAAHDLRSGRSTTRYVARGGKLYVNGRLYVTLPPVRVSARVAVLVGPRTASCGEVFADNLQRGGIPVIGSPTAGVKNSAVGLFDLSDGSLLSVTTSEATDRAGKLLGATVKPDRAARTTLTDARAGRDAELSAAVALLSGTAGR